jgi:hypothetical protein
MYGPGAGTTVRAVAVTDLSRPKAGNGLTRRKGSSVDAVPQRAPFGRLRVTGWIRAARAWRGPWCARIAGVATIGHPFFVWRYCLS